jgi:hypothetical protein
VFGNCPKVVATLLVLMQQPLLVEGSMVHFSRLVLHVDVLFGNERQVFCWILC